MYIITIINEKPSSESILFKEKREIQLRKTIIKQVHEYFYT